MVKQFSEKPLILVCPVGRKDPMETFRTGMVLITLTLSEYWGQRGPKTPASCLYSSRIVYYTIRIINMVHKTQCAGPLVAKRTTSMAVSGKMVHFKGRSL